MAHQKKKTHSADTEFNSNFKIKSLVRVIIFLVIFTLLFSYVSAVFKDKTSAENIATIYELPRNSIDVIFAGTSHPLYAFHPMMLWRDYGIASYNICQGGQMIAQTYYSIEEAFRIQNPTVVVLDLYYIIKKNKVGQIPRAHTTLDNFQWSPVKVKAILNAIPMKNWIEFFVPLTAYHSRWSELTARDFSKPANSRRGAGASFNIEPQVPEYQLTDEEMDISAPSMEYLNKIISLCEKNKVDLVFTVVPYNIGKDNDPTPGDEQLKMFNRAFSIAESHGIPYINYFELMDETGFDFETDLYDATHMNILGTEKITGHMGKYLKENYNLNDYRNDPFYKQWLQDYEEYKNDLLELKTSRIKKCNTLNGYLKLIENETDYTVFMNIGGAALEGLNDRTVQLMNKLGIKTDLRDLKGNSWAAVLDAGKIVYEESLEGFLEYEGRYNGESVRLFSNGEGSYAKIFIGKENVSVNKKGLNIVVYSKSKKKVVDSVSFNLASSDYQVSR